MAFPGGRLSVGSISKIYAGNFNEPVVLQVLEVKKMVANNKAASTGDRFRLILSDSEHLIPAMLTTQLNELAINGTIQQRGVIKMTDYICNPLPAKNGAASKIIVIVELEPVSDALQVQIGSPVDIGGAMSQAAVTPQVAAPAPAAAGYGAPNAQQQQHHQPAQQIVDQATGHVITPVRNLDMYLTRWTIRVRCTTKSQPKEYNSGNGRLFSVTFVDETGEIRATMFNDAVDKFFPIIAEGGMYVISGGKLKFANKKFTSVKHAYELTLNPDSVVIPVESVDSVPRIRFDFTPIDHIQEAKKDDMLDIIAVIVSSKPVTNVTTRKGDTSRRNVTVADNSGRAIELTLWGDQADGFDGMLAEHGPHTILAFKGVRVSDFGGRTLSAMQTTEFEVEPDLEDAHAVRRWWSTVPDEGRHLPSLSNGGGGGGAGGAGGASGGSREKTLNSIVIEKMGLNTQDYLTVPNIYVWNFKREGTMWYKACSNPECKGRKVFDEAGNVKCPKCNGVNAFHLRWVCNFTAYDHTAREYISGFGDAGVTLLGCEAEVMEQHQSAGRADLTTQIFEEGRFKSYNMRLAVKQEEYNGILRNKVSVQSVTPIDYVTDSERLLARIAELQRQ